MKIALVGFGPRGFACLERLALESARMGDPPSLDVTLHDPARTPGSAVIYHREQPDELLLNFPVQAVDAWSPDQHLVPASLRLSLLDWLRQEDSEWATPGAYVPRRLVGAYLDDAVTALLAHLPPSLQVRHVPGEVRRISRAGAGWTVEHGDPRWDRRNVDEVMLTSGHGAWGPSDPGDPWWETLPTSGRTKVVRGVFPVGSKLSLEAVPPGSRVGIRGFALTWIDATLALSAVRGGRFQGLDTLFPSYMGSPRDVATVLPFSRTGIPMSPKPSAPLRDRSRSCERVWERLRSDLALAPEPTSGGIREALGSAAAAALAQMSGGSLSQAGHQVHAVLAELMGAAGGPRTRRRSWDREGVEARDTLERMRRAIAVARGQAPPDGAWALGEAWRQAYPVLVDRVGHGGLAPESRGPFAELAGHMERLAFGPPARNLARMLALVDAGIMDLRFLRGPRVVPAEGGLALRSGRREAPLDVLVDGVTPPSGFAGAGPLYRDLLARGHVRAGAGTGALEITPSAGCVSRSGEPTPGLSALGRVTEGWVLGNDTLTRKLHPHPALWAWRILGVSARDAVPAEADLQGAAP